MNLVRKIKISKLTKTSLLGIDKEIVDFINSILYDLIPFQMEDNLTSIYYMNNKGDWILEQDNKNNALWVRYGMVWKILKYDYMINDINIQTLLKYMVEQAFKQKVSTPYDYKQAGHSSVEQAYKQKITPPIPSKQNSSEVEQCFSQK